jgi:hypothetical protein
MAERLVRAGVTECEAEVLSALAGRLRNREFADQLRVSVRTAESHAAVLPCCCASLVGKTRLALRIAADRGEPFPDGARLADLAPVPARALQFVSYSHAAAPSQRSTDDSAPGTVSQAGGSP